MHEDDVLEIPNEIKNLWIDFTEKIGGLYVQTQIINQDLEKSTQNYLDEGSRRININSLVYYDMVAYNLNREGFIKLGKTIYSDKSKYLDNLEKRINWTILLCFAQCFEEFERFYKECFWFYFSNIGDENKINKNFKQKLISRKNIYGNYKTFFNGLKLLHPEYAEKVVEYCKLQEYFILFTELRHDIVHSYGRLQNDLIDPDIYKNVTKVDLPQKGEQHVLNIKSLQRLLTQMLTVSYYYVSFKHYKV